MRSGSHSHDCPGCSNRRAGRNSHGDFSSGDGHSHLRAALLGPSLTVPFADGKLLTGEYQQVVLIDFAEKIGH